VAVAVPVTVPYVRYSIRSAYWFLGQALRLGQRPVADHAEHVVVDRRLVRGEDHSERVLVPALCLAQDFEIGLRKWH